MVRVASGEDLGFVFKAAEGAGVDDAVAVALKVVAIGMRRLRESASAGLFHLHRVGGQHGDSLAFAGHRLSQSEAHLVAGLEAERFVQVASVCAGVKRDACKT